MHPPRFTFPHPEESLDSLKNITLIITCLQDPKRLEQLNPTLHDAEMLVAHIGASVHPAVTSMIWEALQENKPLDRSVISLTAPTTKAVIEERETLVWNKGQSMVFREVTIGRLSPEENAMGFDEDSPSYNSFEESFLHVKLSRPPTGEICLAVEWENGQEAVSIVSLNHRWEKIRGIFKVLGEVPPPWDSRPFAIEKADPYDDDIYMFGRIVLFAAPFPAELVEHEIEQEREAQARAQEEADSYGTGREDDRDAWSNVNYFSEFEENDDSELDDENKIPQVDSRDEDPYSATPYTTDQPLTILSPTSHQITRIANLSQMAITTGIVEEVLAFTKRASPLMPEAFEGHTARALNDLSIQRRSIFTMCGDLETRHSYALDMHTTAENLPDPALSIILSHEHLTIPGEAPFIKSVFEWTLFSEIATIKNWDTILRVARERYE
jgi:hypothetical protein